MTERERERLAALALGDLPQAEAEGLRPLHGPELARLERVIATLQAEGQHPPAPPQGLAAATVARLPHTTPGRLAWAGRRLLAEHLATAASVAAMLLAVVTVTGLVAAAVGKVRHESELAACRNRLRELHFTLDEYAQTHTKRYPQVGTPGLPVVGELGAELSRAGHSARVAACPAGDAYAYSLGYRSSGGQLQGLRRGADDSDPIAADARRLTHGGGRNVLYTGGAVRYTTVPTVGFNGDDIFQNQLGQARAGLHSADSSLGGPADSP